MIARKTFGLPGMQLDCQGDREGRPYNTNSPVLHVNVYCTGDPRGRPGNHSQTLRPFTSWLRSFTIKQSTRHFKGVTECQRLIAIWPTNIRRELHRCCELSTSERCWSIYEVISRRRGPSLCVPPVFPSQPYRKRSPILRMQVLCGPSGSR